MLDLYELRVQTLEFFLVLLTAEAWRRVGRGRVLFARPCGHLCLWLWLCSSGLSGSSFTFQPASALNIAADYGCAVDGVDRLAGDIMRVTLALPTREVVSETSPFGGVLGAREPVSVAD